MCPCIKKSIGMSGSKGAESLHRFPYIRTILVQSNIYIELKNKEHKHRPRKIIQMKNMISDNKDHNIYHLSLLLVIQIYIMPVIPVTGTDGTTESGNRKGVFNVN